MSFCLGSIASIATDSPGSAQLGRSITLQVPQGWGIRGYAERGGTDFRRTRQQFFSARCRGNRYFEEPEAHAPGSRAADHALQWHRFEVAAGMMLPGHNARSVTSVRSHDDSMILLCQEKQDRFSMVHITRSQVAHTTPNRVRGSLIRVTLRGLRRRARSRPLARSRTRIRSVGEEVGSFATW